jgi:hypothetical protein
VPLARSQSGPSARMWGTLASVSTLLTRVGLSAGGPGEQALHERASHPRQRQTSLDHLFQPGLLPQQVQIRAEDDLDLNAAERVRVPHLPSARRRAWISVVNVSFNPT